MFNLWSGILIESGIPVTEVVVVIPDPSKDSPVDNSFLLCLL